MGNCRCWCAEYESPDGYGTIAGQWNCFQCTTPESADSTAPCIPDNFCSPEGDCEATCAHFACTGGQYGSNMDVWYDSGGIWECSQCSGAGTGGFDCSTLNTNSVDCNDAWSTHGCTWGSVYGCWCWDPTLGCDACTDGIGEQNMPCQCSAAWSDVSCECCFDDDPYDDDEEDDGGCVDCLFMSGYMISNDGDCYCSSSDCGAGYQMGDYIGVACTTLNGGSTTSSNTIGIGKRTISRDRRQTPCTDWVSTCEWPITTVSQPDFTIIFLNIPDAGAPDDFWRCGGNCLFDKLDNMEWGQEWVIYDAVGIYDDTCFQASLPCGTYPNNWVPPSVVWSSIIDPVQYIILTSNQSITFQFGTNGQYDGEYDSLFKFAITADPANDNDWGGLDMDAYYMGIVAPIDTICPHPPPCSYCPGYLYDCDDDDHCILGDINGDGYTNVQDIILMIGLILNGGYNVCGDMNSDGTINIQDVITLVQIIQGSGRTISVLSYILQDLKLVQYRSSQEQMSVLRNIKNQLQGRR